MKLEKIVTIKGTLRCMSGLHIGGGGLQLEGQNAQSSGVAKRCRQGSSFGMV